MGGYRDLRVWQSAMQLAVAVYKLTERFPKHEIYTLTSQIRRASISVPSNIAEGKGRRTRADFTMFLYHARGSLLELETQLLLAKELQYVSEAETAVLLRDAAAVGSALTGLINSLTAPSSSEASLPRAESRDPRA
jgi:four helix bundle protein